MGLWTYAFLGLASGTGEIDVSVTAGEGGSALVGAGVVTLSSSSIISTLHI